MNMLEQNLSHLFERYISDGRIPGVSAQIIQKGKNLAKVVTGFSDIEKQTPLREDSLFRIYSMSKVITIVGAMQLYEKGLFTLETPLHEFIPSFARMEIITGYDGDRPLLQPAKNPILMKHLFTMTSGIPYGFHPLTDSADRFLNRLFEASERDKAAASGRLNTADFTEILSGAALAFEPGSDYMYGYNHDILGRVIELLTGETFGSYLRKNIFDPLDMKDTTFLPGVNQMKRLVPLYRTTQPGECPVKVHSEDPMSGFLFKKDGFESGGGGLISSLGDYSKYCETLLNNGGDKGARIIGRKTLEFMTRNHLTGKALDTMAGGGGYGYGLGVRTLINPSLADLPGSKGEYGWGGAATTWMCVDPKEDLYAVLMLQLLDCPYPIQREFYQILYAGLS